MKLVNKSAFQGDVMFRRVPSLPKAVVEVKRDGPMILAHSETGHHHAVDDIHAKQYSVPGSALISYLQLGDVGEAGGVDVVHHRAWDTHETLRLLGKAGDVWEVRRQREWRPEGWAMVSD